MYFADSPRLADAWRLAIYSSCTSTSWVPIFVRRDWYTKIIDLRSAEEDIFSNFSPTARNAIRRSSREGIVCEMEMDLERFTAFHSDFARSKGLPVRTQEAFLSYGDCLMVTKAVSDLGILCMHSYIVDASVGRATLLTSSSLFRLHLDLGAKGLIGRANRYLHYRDILLFKEQGFATYDLGGYALETTDRELSGINEFKDQFGGTLVRESKYLSYPYLVVQHVKPMIGPRSMRMIGRIWPSGSPYGIDPDQRTA